MYIKNKVSRFTFKATSSVVMDERTEKKYSCHNFQYYNTYAPITDVLLGLSKKSGDETCYFPRTMNGCLMCVVFILKYNNV